MLYVDKTACLQYVNQSRLCALCRFPRFITIRSDRRPEDASTPEVIVDLYNKQSRRMTSAAEMLASKGKGKPTANPDKAQTPDQEAGLDDDDDEAMDS